jgi:hypothetical protein
LQGIVPVHVDATPMIGPPSRAGSTPIALKCARAGARSAPSSNPARARLRRASTGVSLTPSTVLLTHDSGVREDVEGVAARRRELGDDRALVARLERVQRVRRDRVLLARP